MDWWRKMKGLPFGPTSDSRLAAAAQGISETLLFGIAAIIAVALVVQ